MKRFVVIVLDGFGIGETSDVAEVRKEDLGANTLGAILKEYPELKLANLEKLGLMNAFGKESDNMKFSSNAVFGYSGLMHYGADTFAGHQEIMGTKPKMPLIEPISCKLDEIETELKENGYKTRFIIKDNLKLLVVNEVATIGDNIEADYGMVYNVTGVLSEICFEKLLEIGKIVRKIAKVNRVIVFGGTKSTIADLENAVMTKDKAYIGVHASNSKSYIEGYQCVHMGYGVDYKKQVPSLIEPHKTTLIGKVADIVHTNYKSLPMVDTTNVLNLVKNEITQNQASFICANVQQTDLAGHSQDASWYKEILLEADKHIGDIIEMLNFDDILVVMADHGNDPNIGHNKHTRENVPLLIFKKECENINIGQRETLSDVGATICDFFEKTLPENGKSFLDMLFGN